jgi:2-C-methyl-D-erythritol 2,4-cyclodiphosphate synthase
VMQRPKLAPYIGEMRQRIAGALGISVDAVSVKATTTEGMGFEGTGEGVSASAVATLVG